MVHPLRNVVGFVELRFSSAPGSARKSAPGTETERQHEASGAGKLSRSCRGIDKRETTR